MSAPGTGWRRFTFGAGGLAALAVLFLGVVMLSGALLRGARIDLTQNHLYTLSPGTLQVLDGIREPVTLSFYFSRDGAGAHAPLLLPYANHVREFLEELAARSHGRLRSRSPTRRIAPGSSACRRFRPARPASRCTSAWPAATRPTDARSSPCSRPTANSSSSMTSRSWSSSSAHPGIRSSA
jgi:hypothetical protein